MDEKENINSLDEKQLKPVIQLINAISALFKKFGFAQGLLLFIIVIFLFSGSKEQKQYLIDIVLVRDYAEQQLTYIVWGTLVAIGFIWSFYNKHTIKKIKLELNRCSEEKKKLQQKLLAAENLSSSHNG